MTDNNDNNVINFKLRRSKEGGLPESGNTEEKTGEGGNILKAGFLSRFPCVKLLKDNNGNYFNKKVLREYAGKVSYIVSIMRDGRPSAALYRYKVPQRALAEFLNLFKNGGDDGEIIDIEKYIPDDLA